MLFKMDCFAECAVNLFLNFYFKYVIFMENALSAMIFSLLFVCAAFLGCILVKNNKLFHDF